MVETHPALAGALRVPPRLHASARRVLVIGANTELGWAVIEQLHVGGRFERIAALATQPVHVAFHGLVALRGGDDAALRAFAADTAIVVFDRAKPRALRPRAGDDAFVRLDPGALADSAIRLHALGVRRLVVAMPHTAALMPAALQAGLASLDEARVAAIGFEQLVFMRMASRDGGNGGHAVSAPQRLANWMLAQLHWLVPRSSQPVRMTTVAKVTAALAILLPDASPATRVLPSAVLAHAAQLRDVQPMVEGWLAGGALDLVMAPLPRM